VARGLDRWRKLPPAIHTLNSDASGMSEPSTVGEPPFRPRNKGCERRDHHQVETSPPRSTAHRGSSWDTKIIMPSLPRLV
jgi:hypothetical protein